MSYHVYYLSLYEDGGSLYLNKCFLYNKDSKTLYYYKEKVVKVIWSVTGHDDDQRYV